MVCYNSEQHSRTIFVRSAGSLSASRLWRSVVALFHSRWVVCSSGPGYEVACVVQALTYFAFILNANWIDQPILLVAGFCHEGGLTYS